ncbi:hypothetical protein B0T18DRAFT_43917 [Schizothecium vesticola]|uniref:Uncharacterized protein n=1 Tax=Schizothecium vesticola TaxID=314040 RepID=A0AA40FBH7_9PEZI|nr:hypothetical protein B0T18DRAFT_43917 [Schizothecium vesticola]
MCPESRLARCPGRPARWGVNRGLCGFQRHPQPTGPGRLPTSPVGPEYSARGSFVGFRLPNLVRLPSTVPGSNAHISK